MKALMPDPAPVSAEVKLKESPISEPTLPVQTAARVCTRPRSKLTRAAALAEWHGLCAGKGTGMRPV
jgi:hypothetical protein